jgi:hypothetical protein
MIVIQTKQPALPALLAPTRVQEVLEVQVEKYKRQS